MNNRHDSFEVRFNPHDGNELVPGVRAAHFRGLSTPSWLYDPWTGGVRTVEEVGTDPFGLLIVPYRGTWHKGESAPGMYESTLSAAETDRDQINAGVGVKSLPDGPRWFGVDAGEATAIDKVLNERGKRYGVFKGHAKITQSLKYTMYQQEAWEKLKDDQKEALEMIAHKIGRILNGDPNYADSWVDIAGYAQLVADRLNGIER